ncbi:hypothetical protein JTE90_019125, partial [Oedothorax gibbosus]
MCLRFGRRLASETDFSDPLGPTDPCSTAVHMEPFSSFSPQGSHLSICYYHQDLHRWRLQGGLTPGTFNARHRDPPTTLRRKPP